MKRMIANATVLLVAATMAGLGVATATVGAASPETAATATVEPGRYVYPVDVQAARKACFKAEREARNIPGGRDAYAQWWNANEGTPAQLDWSAAYQGCKDRNDVAGAKWSEQWWSNLVKVG